MTPASNLAQPRRGEVWMVDFPNRPNDPHLPRAAIVISNDKLNEFDDCVLVIPVFNDEKTSRLLPTHMALPKGTGGLYKDSRAKCEYIASIHKDKFVGVALGVIPSITVTGLIGCLKKAVE